MASTADWHKAHLGQQLQALLPVLLLGSLALLTYWLVQNSPILAEAVRLTAPVPDCVKFPDAVTGFTAS